MIECPNCGKDDSKVLESGNRNGQYVRRRRCNVCGENFSTKEYTSKAIKSLIYDAFDDFKQASIKKFGVR